MSEFDHKEFKVHLNKIIGYLDDITNKLNGMLDSYLLVEQKPIKKKERKPKKK